MSILQTIQNIDINYDADPMGIIEVNGLLSNGQEIEMCIVNHDDENGPELWPGFWFLPYGGVYSCPLIVSVKEQD